MTENSIFRLTIGRQGLVPQAAQQKVDAALQKIHALFQEEASAPLADLERGLRAWTRSHLQDEDIAQGQDVSHTCAGRIFGAGCHRYRGSDLSARVFHDSFNHPYHNLLSLEERGGAPEVYFTGDTFDPRKLFGLIEMLKTRNLLQKTLSTSSANLARQPRRWRH